MKCYGGKLDFLVVWENGAWELRVGGQIVGRYGTCGEAFARAREMEIAPESVRHTIDSRAILDDILDRAGRKKEVIA